MVSSEEGSLELSRSELSICAREITTFRSLSAHFWSCSASSVVLICYVLPLGMMHRYGSLSAWSFFTAWIYCLAGQIVVGSSIDFLLKSLQVQIPSSLRVVHFFVKYISGGKDSDFLSPILSILSFGLSAVFFFLGFQSIVDYRLLFRPSPSGPFWGFWIPFLIASGGIYSYWTLFSTDGCFSYPNINIPQFLRFRCRFPFICYSIWRHVLLQMACLIPSFLLIGTHRIASWVGLATYLALFLVFFAANAIVCFHIREIILTRFFDFADDSNTLFHRDRQVWSYCFSDISEYVENLRLSFLDQSLGRNASVRTAIFSSPEQKIWNRIWKDLSGNIRSLRDDIRREIENIAEFDDESRPTKGMDRYECVGRLLPDSIRMSQSGLLRLSKPHLKRVESYWYHSLSGIVSAIVSFPKNVFKYSHDIEYRTAVRNSFFRWKRSFFERGNSPASFESVLRLHFRAVSSASVLSSLYDFSLHEDSLRVLSARFQECCLLLIDTLAVAEVLAHLCSFQNYVGTTPPSQPVPSTRSIVSFLCPIERELRRCIYRITTRFRKTFNGMALNPDLMSSLFLPTDAMVAEKLNSFLSFRD